MSTSGDPHPEPDLDLLDDTVAGPAGFRVDFGRDDSDSFNLNVHNLSNESSSSGKPSNEDLLPLLPRGSDWNPALGWRSFFGVPYRYDDELWLALGIRKVVEHDRRGAYPVSRFYLLPFVAARVRDVLDRLLARLRPRSDEEGTVDPSYGAVRSAAGDPDEHRSLEVDLLRRARAAYEKEIHLLFRTAVLTEDELPASTFLGLLGSASSPDDSRMEFARSLYATVPPVHEQFDWSSRLQVFLETDLTF